MKYLLSILTVLLCCTTASGQRTSKDEKILRALANSSHRINFAITAARLQTGINTDRAYRDLDTMLTREYGDMFWMYGMAGLYHATKDFLPDTIKQKMRWAWKHLTPYRGDTENHFLMYYSSLFLMSEVWPDLEGSEWFTGQSSQEIQKESKEYLLHWIDEVAKYGLIEFDSPRYQYYIFTPLVLLASYAQDAEVKRKSEMLLELMIADYAVKYVNGNYAGAHSRTTDAYALTGTLGETTTYGQYFFEDSVTNLQPDLGFIAISGYKCPKIIKQIAKHKQFPFELFESKRERPALRYKKSDEPVAKYTYIDRDYSMGSLSGGIVQPIQQQSWKLLFHDNTSPNTITGHHPYRSARELATYFPEEPSLQAERIEDTKAGYSSDDKWVGGSPYEKLYQDSSVLIAEYEIPAGVESQHADLFIPSSIQIDGLGDTVLPGRRVSIEHDSERFVLMFLHAKFLKIKEPNGTRFRSLAPNCGYMLVPRNKQGYAVRMATHLADLRTERQEESKQTLYRSPYINAKRGSGVITLSYGSQKRILNFATGRVQGE